MFQNKDSIDCYFAYRLPYETEVYYLSGDAVKIADLNQIHQDGILLHSFSGDTIFFIRNCVPVEPENFRITIRESQNDIVWNQSEYLQAFEKVQAALTSGQFQKLILSRIKAVETNRDGLAIFQDLNKTYTGTFNYIFSSAETGTWIGASPELLLKASGTAVSTVSLAGTKPADGFSEWTKKEREEQKFVTDFILNSFSKNKVKQIVATEVYTQKAGPVEHLKCDISGIAENVSTVFSLLRDLHPTPATCGIPKEASMLKISEIEAHKRQFYTGFIGILNNDEKIFFVNLRCMELQTKRALLFVGGGITKASAGEKEWMETERKAETLKRIL